MTTPPALLRPELARDIARLNLAANHPRRWAHTEGVAVTVAYLLDYVALTPADEALLLSSAWLHDIGYGLRNDHSIYQWYPLDGAAYLRANRNESLACVVAWHGTNPEEAALLNLTDALTSYATPNDLVVDSLTYATMTTGEDGRPCTLEQRLVEVRARHGADSTRARAIEQAWPRLKKIDERLTALIDGAKGW